MPRPSFYNDNEYRAYPFVYSAAPTQLPNSAIVDAGFVMRLDARFIETEHAVWLHSITRVGDQFYFEFHTDAAPEVIIFQASAAGQDWQTHYEESAARTAGPGAPCADNADPVWEGFVVVGPVADLNAVLPADDTLTFAPRAHQVEPARIQNLNKGYLRTISVGNYERTTAPACGEDNPTETVIPKIVENKRCMRGNLRFKPGYNCTIQQVDWNNEIIIGAGLGEGDKTSDEICENGSELPLYTGETVPAGEKFFSGGPACDDLIFTLNGLGGPTVTITGGPGVSVATQTEPPRITITRNTTTGGGCDN